MTYDTRVLGSLVLVLLLPSLRRTSSYTHVGVNLVPIERTLCRFVFLWVSPELFRVPVRPSSGPEHQLKRMKGR